MSKTLPNFEKTFVNVLDAHAARKTKVLRSNHKSHADKNLRKAIIKLNLKTKQIELNFKMILLNIRKHRENIKTSKNSKPFWTECKSYFSNKHAHGDSKIILIEKEKITNISNEVIKKETLLVNNDEIAKTINKHFEETVETLNIFERP